MGATELLATRVFQNTELVAVSVGAVVLGQGGCTARAWEPLASFFCFVLFCFPLGGVTEGKGAT